MHFHFLLSLVIIKFIIPSSTSWTWFCEDIILVYCENTEYRVRNRIPFTFDLPIMKSLPLRLFSLFLFHNIL